MKTLSLAIALFFALCASAQPLTGTWLSYYFRDKPGDKRMFFYRIYLKQSADSLYGVCETLDIRADSRGFHPEQATVTSRQVVYNHAHVANDSNRFQLRTSLSKEGGVTELFTGGRAPLFQTLVCRIVPKGQPFHSQVPIIYSIVPVPGGPIGELQMQKVSDSVPDFAFLRKSAPAVPAKVNPPAQVKAKAPEKEPAPVPRQAPVLTVSQRARDVQAVIEASSDSARLELYDNGEIDNDTVSLYLNGQLLLTEKRLSREPIVLQVKLERGKDNELLLFAHNLGDIPPNTALLVVTTGGRQHRVTLAGTLQKNALVVLRTKRVP